MRSGPVAAPLAGALLAILYLGSAVPARADDIAPSLTVQYDPPRLSVEARGVSLARVLAEIGRTVGFSVVDRSNSADPVSISVHAASVSCQATHSWRCVFWHSSDLAWANSERFDVKVKPPGRFISLAWSPTRGRGSAAQL